MNAIRDASGAPAVVRFRFWPEAAVVGTEGEVDADRTAAVPPVATLDAAPEAVFARHLDDLAFLVGRASGVFEGAQLAVGVAGQDGAGPSLPVLELRHGAGEAPSGWADAEVLARRTVALCTLDVSACFGALERRGLVPRELVFDVTTAPWLVPERRGRWASSVAEGTPWLRVEVPTLPRGKSPTGGVDLGPLPPSALDLPVFVRRALLERLVADEAAFGAEAGSRWTERTWLLLGELLRGPDGPFVRIDDALAVEGAALGPAHVQFSPLTWLTARDEVARRGLRVVGQLHTHSVAAIERVVQAARRAERASEEPSEESPAAPGGRPADGLFLSEDDRLSAERHGFRAPYMTVGVLDADVAARELCKPGAFDALFGMWGWTGGRLVRRSVRVVD